MKNMFSVDTKFYQFLMRVSELILLNLLYLLCCLPVFSIGAAQAGMMNAMRLLQDKEDDSSVYKAFFRGFSCGFGKITILWLVSIAFIGVLAFSTLATVYYDGLYGSAPVIMSLIALILLMAFQVMAVCFHSRFDCSLWQIIRSTLFMLLMHPFRALCMTVVIWLPVLVMLLDLDKFILVSPAFLLIYYTVAFQLAVGFMQKPFEEIEAEHIQADAVYTDGGIIDLKRKQAE